MSVNYSAVGIPGLEPGTSSLSAKRSNRLSYIPELGQMRDYLTPHGISEIEPNPRRQLFVKPTSRPPVIFTLRL